MKNTDNEIETEKQKSEIKLEKQKSKVEKAIAKKENKNKKLPKEISQEFLKRILKNLFCAIGLMLYFFLLNMAYQKMNVDRLLEDVKVFSAAFLVGGLYMLEKAYKQDSGKKTITAIELMVLAMHSLSIMHVITMFKYDFRLYLLTSSYIIAIYFVFKSIVMYTKGKHEYWRSLSDISEIVKEDEPVKKEATKKNETSKEATKKNETSKEDTKKNEISKETTKKNGKSKEPTKKNKKLKEATKENKISKEPANKNKTSKETTKKSKEPKEVKTPTKPKTKSQRGKTKKEVKKDD